MKRGLILAAALVVVVSNLWVVVSVNRNRRTVTNGPVSLTERELRLSPMIGESTATFLDLKWNVHAGTAEEGIPAEWLNAAKLAELGFDCHVAATNATARDHYESLSSMPVYIVLEYEGDAEKAFSGISEKDARSALRTHLTAVDAAKDPAQLRVKYPDLTRWILVHGLIRPFVQDRERWDRKPLPEPRLRGWIEVFPSQIFVPKPHNQVLQALRRDRNPAEKEQEAKPRFAVTVCWGAGYEPWVQSVRLLPSGSEPGSK